MTAPASPDPPPPPWVARVQTYSWALNLLGLVLPVWLNLFPVPLALALLACIAAPAAVIVLVALSNGGLVTVGARKGRSKDLMFLFFAPLIGLVLRVWSDVEFLNTASSLLPAAGGILAGLAAYAVWRRGGLGMLVVGAASAYALYAEADVRLDRAPPQYMRVAVSDKHITVGRKSGKSYYLDLPPWGPRHDSDAVEVGQDLYDTVEPGQFVCIVLHPGYLAGPWFRIDACPVGATSVPAPPPS
jgi:hypothetical protein